MPITSEGNQIGKEVEAIKDVLNHLETMGAYLQERPSALSGGGNAQADAHFRTSVTNRDPPGHHYHELYIPHEDMTAPCLSKTPTAPLSVSALFLSTFVPWKNSTGVL
jgi:hypothetical protein